MNPKRTQEKYTNKILALLKKNMIDTAAEPGWQHVQHDLWHGINLLDAWQSYKLLTLRELEAIFKDVMQTKKVIPN